MSQLRFLAERGALALALLFAIAAPTLVHAQTYTLSGRTDYAAGTGVQCMAIWDLNNDQIKDLVTVNYGSNNISVLLGNPGGTFQPKVDYAVGTGPFWIVVTDLNNDVQADLVVANNTSESVSVLLGDGSGAFGAKTDFPSGANTSCVATGDFNEDGNRDIATVNSQDDNVSIFLGNGAGGLAPRVNYTSGDGPNCIAVGDFNKDKHADIVVTNYFASSISILRGNGNGTFQPKVDSAVGTNPGALTLAYLNGDDIIDLATANSGPSTVSVRFGNGTGGFAAKIDYATGITPAFVQAADLNIDGKVDLVTGNVTQNNVTVLLNSGTGTFPTHPNTTVGGGPYTLAIADLTDDGEPDIVTGNYFTNNVTVLSGNVPGGFRVNAQIPDLVAPDQNGVSRSLSGSLGKWVLLDMCANWCGPCNQMAEEAQQVYDTWLGHPTVQFEYLTALVDGPVPGRASTQANAQSWATSHEETRPVLHGSGLQQAQVRPYMEAIGTNAYPTILIIDPTGKIVFRKAGAFDGQTTVDKIAAFAGVPTLPLAVKPPPPPPVPAPLAMRPMSAATIEISYGASTWSGPLSQTQTTEDLRGSSLYAGNSVTGVPGIPGNAWIGANAFVDDNAVERVGIFVGTLDEHQLIGLDQTWRVRLTSVTWPDGEVRILDPSTSPKVSLFYYDPTFDTSPFLETPIEAFFNWTGTQLNGTTMAIGNVANLPPTTNGFAVDGIQFRHVGTVDVTPVIASTRLELATPFPNPAQMKSSLRWSMPRAAEATLEIYDVAGRRVAQLHAGKAEAGDHTSFWNLADENGAHVAPGIYFVRFASGSEERTTRLVVAGR